MKNKVKLLLLLFVASLLFFKTDANAKKLDEILNYTIKADVNQDATVTLTYHIEWKVLDSTTEGPLEWAKVGIPNSHYIDYGENCSDIKTMSIKSGGSESYARLDLNRAYKAGEIVVMDFYVVQDYLYQVNKFIDGQTVYEFVPGWFNEIDVDSYELKWDGSKAISWDPTALSEDGYLTWRGSIPAGEKVRVSVTYENEAYSFDLSKNIDNSGSSTDSSDASDAICGVFCMLICIGIVAAPLIALNKGTKNYSSGSGFGSTTKKITRTKIVYYPSCEGCGAVRQEGQTECPYCGRSFIKSEEVITEEDLKNEEKEAAGFKKDGIFKYSSDPDTYVRVNVVNIPRPRPTCAHSSCAHSSCACAHSCACACACACAGGGRAGCTNKDFYNTNLKLKMLELKAKKKK